MRQKRKNKIIILSLLGLLCIMTAGYAAFQTNLKIKGTSGISSNWDIIISNIEKIQEEGSAEEAKVPTGIGSLTADMEVNLYEKGDYIEYEVTVLNRGTIDAVLSNISPSEREYIDPNNKAIKISFSGVNINDKLLKGDTHKLKVRIEYNPDFNGIPEIGSVSLEIGLEYTQAEMAGVPTLNPNLYVSSNGDDTKGNGSKSNPYLTLAKAYTEADDNSTIYIMDDITQTETLNLNEDKDITITSDGSTHSIIRGNELKQTVINQILGTLTFENIIVNGNNVEADTAMINIDGSVNINQGTSLIKAKVLAGEGGALYNGGKLIINGGIISSNSSSLGGAIYNQGNILINDGTFTNNTSTQNGGAIYLNSGTMTIKNGTFSSNTALSGGAIFNMDGNITIDDGKISGNSSSNRGGGIYTTGTLTINGGEISNNTALLDGGGIAEADGSIKKYTTITGGTIKNNTASLRGGGIWDNDKVTIEGGTITGNKAKYGAGILLNGGSTLILNKGTITGNVASSLGGGVFISTYLTTFTNNITISGNTPDNTHQGNEHAS